MINKRALGPWETSLSILHNQLHGTGDAVSMLGFACPLQQNLFTQALELCFQKHPTLRSIIVSNNNQFYFETSALFTDIPIVFVKKEAEDQWQTIAENLFNQPFQANQYLWRCYVLVDQAIDDHVLLLNIHHAACDGLSLLKLNEEVLKIYAMLLNNIKPTIDPLPFESPIEDIIRTRCNPSDALPLIENNEPFEENTIPYMQYAPIGERSTKNIYQIIQAKDNEKITAAAKKHGVSVGAFLNAAMLIGAKQAFELTSLNTKVITPVNLRSHCNPPIPTSRLGFFITCTVTKHRVNEDTNFWKLAEDYKKQLNAQINTSIKMVYDSKETDLSKLSSLLDIESALERQQFSSGFCISNKGKTTIESNFDPISLNFYYAATSRQAGDIVMNLAITTIRKALYITFTYAHPLITNQKAHLFVKYFNDAIKRYSL